MSYSSEELQTMIRNAVKSALIDQTQSLQNELTSLKAEIRAVPQPLPSTSLSPPPAVAPEIAPTRAPASHEEGKRHYIGAWQKFCPTCGDPNPDFKDETVCDGCGMRLGAKEVAEKLKACPNCGGKSAKKI